MLIDEERLGDEEEIRQHEGTSKKPPGTTEVR
jgi:hypothetical protein